MMGAEELRALRASAALVELSERGIDEEALREVLAEVFDARGGLGRGVHLALWAFVMGLGVPRLSGDERTFLVRLVRDSRTSYDFPRGLLERLEAGDV